MEYQRNNGRYGLFLILNIAVVIFVFLAFVFSVSSYVSGKKDIADRVNNNQNNVAQFQSGVAKTFAVQEDFQVYAGSVVSYCAHTNDVCEGLGPAWWGPTPVPESNGEVVLAQLTQLNPGLAVYSYVSDDDHTKIHVSVIDTSAQRVAVRAIQTKSLPDAVTHLRAVRTSEPNVAVILYSSHNTTYIVAATVSGQNNTNLQLGTEELVFEVDNSNTTSPLRSDIAYADKWTLISWGYDGADVNYKAYMIDSSATRLVNVLTTSDGLLPTVFELIVTSYVGDGKIIQSNANHMVLGQIDFTNRRISRINQADLPHHFDHLQMTPIYNNWVVLSGVQSLYVDSPITIALVVSSTNLTFMGSPSNLFSTTFIEPKWTYLSPVYVPPHEREPYGGLFHSYIDARSGKAKIVRSRPVQIGTRIQIVSSPSFDVSSYQYGRWYPPIISGPIADNRTLIMIQDKQSIVNTFFWWGGYQYAGIAQANATAGQKVSVVREGISSGHNNLIPGAKYYATNYGALLPYTLTLEQFTYNANRFHIGVAINQHQLRVETNAFDSYGWWNNL